ncbi:MAG TPA: VOC family protein [Thermoanaerobaculia bacterium]|nr:VOC family protein [Thermoanaerobaculia bacterium]
MASPETKIATCLWFDSQAEEAAELYVSLVPDSRIDAVHRAPADFPSGKAGDVLTVEFTLAGQRFTGLNGGPLFRFNEAASIQVYCEDQQEVDRLWEALSAHPEAEQCGWVKDRFGLSWQIIPRALTRLLSDPDPERAQRAMTAMLGMKKLDVAGLQRAADGAAAQ